MMNKIFLAFSNSQHNPLLTLQREDREVHKILSRREKEQHFSLHRESNANIPDVAHYLQEYQKDIILFQFSGHAGNNKLIIDDKPANTQGIVLMLRNCPNLHLLILNGCSTKGQVQALLNAGIPVVIATSAPVEDPTATQFSISFFQSLSDGYKSIREAFDDGIGAAQTVSTNNLKAEKRDIGLEAGFLEDKDNPDEPLWGLYYRKESDLDWKLPKAKQETNSIHEPRRLDAAMPSQVITKRHTELWVQICLPDSDGFRATLPQYTSSGEEINKGDVRDTTLPVKFPIGSSREEPMPAFLTIEVKATDFDIAEPVKEIELSPYINSGVIIFNLTPSWSNERSIVHVEVKHHLPDAKLATLGAVSLYTKVAPKEVGDIKATVWILNSIELALVGVDPKFQDLVNQLLSHDKDSLYSLLKVHKLCSSNAPPPSAFEIIMEGKEAFERHKTKIFKKLLIDGNIDEKQSYLQVLNEKDQVSLISKMLHGIQLDVVYSGDLGYKKLIFVFASIIVKIGVKNFCSQANQSNETLANFEKTDHDIVRLNLKNAERDIYMLSYGNALDKLKAVSSHGFLKSDIAKAYLEIAFWTGETGNTQRAKDIIESASLLINKNLDPSLPYRKAIKALDPDVYKKLMMRYFPIIINVEGGTFDMGCNPGEKCKDQHSQTVSSFQIAKYPATWWQYYLFCKATGHEYKKKPVWWELHGDNPVVNVSWFDAVLYANWLNKQFEFDKFYIIENKRRGTFDDLYDVTLDPNAKRGFRLPTEAEWEYAAKGGKQPDNTIYSGSNDLNEVGWYYYSEGRTHPVGTKKANSLGLYDMSGNVFEWCWDKFGEYELNPEKDYRGPYDGSYRVVRGGSWNRPEVYCRTASRYGNSPDDWNERKGFRLVFVT